MSMYEMAAMQCNAMRTAMLAMLVTSMDLITAPPSFLYHMNVYTYGFSRLGGLDSRVESLNQRRYITTYIINL